MRLESGGTRAPARRRTLAGSVLLGLVVSAPLCGQPFPLGGEFAINTFTDSYQGRPHVAYRPDGSFVVAWRSNGGEYTVRARRFAANGTPLDEQDFQVSTFSAGGAYGDPAVAVDGTGRFVVVWKFDEGSSETIRARRFAASGVALDPSDFLVSTLSASLRGLGSKPVGFDAQGRFVVVWHSSSGSGDGDMVVHGRRFAANGTPLDPVEFRVNTYTTNYQQYPSVAVRPSGDFLATWQSYGSFGGDFAEQSVQARRFQANGTPIDPQEFQVNTYTFGPQRRPSIGAAADGRFVIAWETSNLSIESRRFSAAATPLDPVEQRANTSGYFVTRAAVGVAPDADFVLAWNSDGSLGNDDDDWSVQARRYRASGAAVDSAEFQVNTGTAFFQLGASVGVGPTGDFVVAWGSGLVDGDDAGVQGQRYAEVFRDGFESGSSGQWSHTVGTPQL